MPQRSTKRWMTLPLATRRTIALLLVAAVLGGLATLTGTIANATSSVKTERVGGADRYDTAKLIALDAFKNGATNAIVATGENFPDALAGSYLAGFKVSPMLLTAKDSIPAPLSDALKTLKVKNVVVLGGVAAISKAVEDQLKATVSTNGVGGNLNVTRIGGADRYETAMLTADGVGAPPSEYVGSLGQQKTAIVATGEKFPDATSAGVEAWAAKLPMLLTPKDTLAAPTSKALTDLAIKQVLLLGGTAAISGSVETQIKALNGGITVVRLEGANRNETATAIASYALANLGFKPSAIDLARGDDFPDALVGGPHAAREDAVPILLTATPDDLSVATAAYIDAHDGTLAQVTALGGPAAISDKTLQAAAKAGTCVVSSSTSSSTTIPATTTTTNGGLPTTIPPTTLPPTTLIPPGGTSSTTSTTVAAATSSTIKACRPVSTTSSTNTTSPTSTPPST